MTTKKFDVKALRDKVLNSDDIKYDEVYVKEWDTTLPVKTLSAADMKKVMKFKDDEVRMFALAMLNGCVTSDGEAVFGRDDLAILEKEKAFGPILTVGAKVMELSGAGSSDDVEEAKNN